MKTENECWHVAQGMQRGGGAGRRNLIIVRAAIDFASNGSDLCMANRSIGLCRGESIDGVGGDLKAPAVSDLPVEYVSENTEKNLPRQDRRRLTKQREEKLSGQQLARGLSCRWLPPIHPSAIRLTCTHQPSSRAICSPAAAHRVVEEEEERTRSFGGSPRFRSLEHSSNHPRKPLP